MSAHETKSEVDDLSSSEPTEINPVNPEDADHKESPEAETDSELLQQSADSPPTLSETPLLPKKVFDHQIANFVVDALRVVEPTLHSVSSCAINFQSRFAHDPLLISKALRSAADFFLSVDPATKLNAFYVLNDLIQRDPRFRLCLLSEVIPRICWSVSSLTDKDPYVKTVAVWESRSVYPSEVCKKILASFNVANVATKNAEEFEQRLSSLIDMARIRAAKDIDLEQLFSIDEVLEAETASAPTVAAIMAASSSELKTIASAARASLSVTQGTTEYLSRLMLDFQEALGTSNSKSMEHLLNVLETAAIYKETS